MERALIIAISFLWLVSGGMSVPLAHGPNSITVEATDIARNTGSSSMTVNLSQPESVPDPQTSPSASNAQGTLYGENMGDFIVLDWDLNDAAAEYFVYRSTSLNGPWKQVLRTREAAARTGGARVDLTPDARVMDLCYKVEVIDATGLVIETYEPICVPKLGP